MAVEGFVIHRYSDFPVWAVAVALVWYGFNDVVDYFVPIVGTYHHTTLPMQPITDGVIHHVVPAHQIAGCERGGSDHDNYVPRARDQGRETRSPGSGMTARSRG